MDLGNLQGLLSVAFDLLPTILWKNKPSKKYSGSAVEICQQIVADRWNGTFFESAESPRLNQFWVRDTAWCLEGLLDLGYQNEVEKNYAWALEVFAKNNRITEAITKNGVSFDIPSVGVDSLPMLLYALKTAGLNNLVQKHQSFLNSQIKKYFADFLDPKTQLIKNEIYACTAKDAITRKYTCAGNVFLIFTQQLLRRFPELTNSLKNTDLVTPFIDHFWQNNHFINDTDPHDEFRFISSDANVWPYWTGVIRDGEMLKKSLDAISKEHLDEPFPVKFQNFYNPNYEYFLNRIFIPNYNGGNSIMTLLGPIYIELEAAIYPVKAQKHLRQYLDLIEKFQTFPEVLVPNGKSLLGGNLGASSDTGMLWAAMIPRLVKKIL